MNGFDGWKTVRRSALGRGSIIIRAGRHAKSGASGPATVEDNLAALRILAQEIGEQRRAVASSQYYLELAVTRFRAGIDSYRNVITAQTTLLSNRVTEVQTQLRQMNASVALILALGGGWEADELPSVHDILREPRRSVPASEATPSANRP
jgi:hypothetical protein